jgi:hypothetical protein
MKGYFMFFLLLKLFISIQIVLIFLKREQITSVEYLLNEIVFKVTLAIFIEYFCFHKMIDGIEFEDRLIISFSGGLLLFDALVMDLPILLKKLKIKTPFNSI